MCIALDINNITKKYKDFELKGLSLTLEAGYIMGFIGPNGSGKTTTIQAIMNLIPLDSGTISMWGMDHVKYEDVIKNRMGFVYDDCPYFSSLSLKDNAKIIAPFYSNWKQDTFEKYMKRFELDPNKKLSKLSKGMKTKFSLAMALSHDAELIIMDEPTSGLDPIFRREILDIFYDVMQDGNRSILFSTHITSDLDKIADYITYIDNGELVFTKPMPDIKDNYKIVKGDNDILKKIPDDFLLGIRKTQYGFDALTLEKDTIVNLVGDSVLFENALLEDIMFYLHKKHSSASSIE